MSVSRRLLLEVLEDVGVDPARVHWDYSGRFMYGRTCFGFVGEDADLVWFFTELGRRLGRDEDDAGFTEGDVDELVRALRTDEMGLDKIYYFPSVDLPVEPAGGPGDESEALLTAPVDADELGDPDVERDRRVDRELGL